MRLQHKRTTTEHPIQDHGPMTNEDVLQSLFRIVRSLPVREQQVVIGIMDQWFNRKPRERAFYIKLLNPELSDAEVARRAGVHRSSLFRSRVYMSLKGHVDHRRRDRRGFKTRDGRIEGFDENDCHEDLD